MADNMSIDIVNTVIQDLHPDVLVPQFRFFVDKRAHDIDAFLIL